MNTHKKKDDSCEPPFSFLFSFITAAYRNAYGLFRSGKFYANELI
jgi:hypothetical protein